MATIIWCDRAKYVVQESRSEVHRRIAEVQGFEHGDPLRDDAVFGFAYFTRGHKDSDGMTPDGQQVCLNTRLISAFEAVPGHGI